MFYWTENRHCNLKTVLKSSFFFVDHDVEPESSTVVRSAVENSPSAVLLWRSRSRVFFSDSLSRDTFLFFGDGGAKLNVTFLNLALPALKRKPLADVTWNQTNWQSFLGSLAVRTSAKWSSIFFQSASEMASLCFTGASRPCNCRFFSFKRPSRTALALLNSGSVKMFMVMDAESQRWIAALADTYELRLYMSPPFVLTSTK